MISCFVGIFSFLFFSNVAMYVVVVKRMYKKMRIDSNFNNFGLGKLLNKVIANNGKSVLSLFLNFK